jgi:rhamnopyranosyl-N-acetylglucosaminyl-diphospho-decaprenol beta-1,3/1,4-galactofuranosyltransferase
VVRLPENTGASGGFAAGLAAALGIGRSWIWIMDDDSLPDRDALERLMEVAEAAEPAERVGAVAPLVDYDGGPAIAGRSRTDGAERPEHIDWGPFVAMLLRAEACREVGLTRQDFFIWNDDLEYCMRMRLAGWEFRAAPAARIRHPWTHQVRRRLLGKEISSVWIPPWKCYYGVRNSLILERELDGTAMAAPRNQSQRIRFLLKDSLIGLLVGADGSQRAWMTLRGIADGLRERTGKRVEPGERPWLWRTFGRLR